MDFNPFLVPIDPTDHRLEDSLDFSPRVCQIPIGRSKPANLCTVENRFDGELDAHVGRAKTPTALEDIEPGRLTKHLKLASVQSLLNWRNLDLQIPNPTVPPPLPPPPGSALCAP